MCLATGFVQHPITNRVDQAGIFRHLDKLVGHDQTQITVLPADECLDTNNQAAPQADQRLIMQYKFLLLECPAQVALHHQAVKCRLVHFRCVELEGVAALLLGFVHRHVSVFEQRFDVLAVLRVNADADRGRYRQFVPGD